MELEADAVEAKAEYIADEMEGSVVNNQGVKSVSADVAQTNPARGSSYIPTPERFAHPKCGLINIRNTDQRCFAYCMKYHQSEKKKTDHRITVLDKKIGRAHV